MTPTIDPAGLELFTAEDTHYGIAVSHIGDDGEGLIAIGHHPLRRVIAAFNRHHRCFVGLAGLHDDPSQHAADVARDIKTIWAVFRRPNPSAGHENPDYDWYLDTVAPGAPGAVPVMWLAPR